MIEDAGKWKKVNIVFKLKSPLHIGYTPFKGSVVSPTRYYVPGRNLWGATTKRITENLCEKPVASNYQEIGKQIKEIFKFSYFYLYGRETIFIPKYTVKGIVFGDRDKKKLDKSEFEHRFIGSRVLTAIDYCSGTAKDESLHEIEFINNKFKDEIGNLKDTKIAGCIWVKEGTKIGDKKIITNGKGIFIDNFNIVEQLILGGESKYGFGDVLLDSINKVNFPIEIEESNKIKVEIKKDKPLLLHLKYDRNVKFKGDLELLTGRGYFDPEKLENENNREAFDKPGKIISQPEYYFSPGAVLIGLHKCIINWDGTLVKI